ncbi:sugar phosphate isomerase/epimerase family protein [Marinococcus halophilus]|uniref:sugar phosphate isomerase/epimerase family protein n=1 Tax=Marinococcus halophilus TaxID=1371 RepID=UPI0009A8BC66|nr:sugar phosphate isomerase/epimerase [Marinococcus halophilus]
MLYGLNGSTTDQCTLEEDILVAEHAGYDVVELRTYKLEAFLKHRTLDELNKLFEQSSVKADAINAIEFFNLKKGEEREQVLKDTEKWCRIAQAAGSSYVIAVPSPRPPEVSNEEIVKDSVQMLQEMSDIGRKYQVNIALEFIGIENFSIKTMEAAKEIMDEVDRENLGLVLDVFHFYTGGSSLDAIGHIPTEKIFVFHINDAEHAKIEELEDKDRIFPGLGVIPLQEIGKRIQKTGPIRMVGLELFRPDYWEMEKYRLGERSYQYVKEASDKMFA